MKIVARSLYADETRTTKSTFSPVVIDFGCDERELPTLQANTMRLQRAYDRASASAYESAWEQFVSQAAQSASEFQISEIAWLLDRIRNGSALPYRRALSLVQAAGAIANARREMSSEFAAAFAAMLAHSVAEVRAAAIEATCEADIASAKHLAREFAEDANPVVRQTAEAVLTMTE